MVGAAADPFDVSTKPLVPSETAAKAPFVLIWTCPVVPAGSVASDTATTSWPLIYKRTLVLSTAAKVYPAPESLAPLIWTVYAPDVEFLKQ